MPAAPAMSSTGVSSKPRARNSSSATFSMASIDLGCGVRADDGLRVTISLLTSRVGSTSDPYVAPVAFAICSRIDDGVSGNRVMVTPMGARASLTAFTTAGGAPMAPPSPTPL